MLGVVLSRGEYYAASDDQFDEDSVQAVKGDVAPGDYLLVLTSGLGQVRVDPEMAPILAGKNLTVADDAGLATLAGADTERDLILGRAMESEPDENGLLWAMISVQ